MKKIYLIIILFLISSCNINNSIKRQEGQGLLIPTNTLNNPPSFIQLEPTSTEKIEKIKTFQVDKNENGCTELPPSTDWKNKYTGLLFLASEISINDRVLEMRTGKSDPLLLDKNFIISNISISPNREWIAYEKDSASGKERFLVIRSLNKNKKIVYPIKSNEWQSIAYWLNNEIIILWDHISNPDKIILFSVFSGKQDIEKDVFPELLAEDYGWNLIWPSLKIYSPLLDKVIYLKNSNMGYREGDVRLSLWDLKENKTISEIDNFGFSQVYPLWKSDGSGLVYVKSLPGDSREKYLDDVYYLSSNGEYKQLTNFSDYFVDSRIYSYSFSPDEKYLAINILTADKQNSSLKRNHIMILNMTTNQLIDYCNSPTHFSSLIWSPNGKQLVFSEKITNDNENDYRAVLIDLIEKKLLSWVMVSIRLGG